MSNLPATVKVSKVALKGKPLDGSYPVVKIDETSVWIKHPEHNTIRVPRANTDLPGAAPVTLSYDELVTEIRGRFDILSGLVDGIIDGNIRSVIVSGAPGVGKTHTVETKLTVAKVAGKIRRFNVVRGTVSPIGLYVLLWENRRAGEVIVLDDSDSIFFDETGASLIKAATDSGKKRTVSYMKEVSMLEANGIPKSFTYEGSIVVATNINFEREVAMKSKIAQHLGAVLNRALYVDLGLHSKQSLMARVEDVCRTTPMLKDEGLTESQVEDVIGWLKDNQSTVRSLSLRTAMVLAGLIKTRPNDWRKTAKVTLLHAVQR